MGLGTRAVLVHGSLATGADEWQAQRPLADEGLQLLVLDRRGYGKSPAPVNQALLALWHSAGSDRDAVS